MPLANTLMFRPRRFEEHRKIMTEESKATADEGAVATEELPAAEAATEGVPAESGAKPQRIGRDLLTEEAREEAATERRKLGADISYEIKGEETLPQAVTSLKFEVAADVFKVELDNYYDKLRSEITLPGYRKGKAPIKLIRIRMGEDADQDAMTHVATNTLRQEVLKREWALLADPEIVDSEINPGDPLTFEVHLERESEVEVTEYKGLKVTVETQEPSDALIDEELEQLRSRNAVTEAAPKGAKVAEDSVIVIDIDAIDESGNRLAEGSRSDASIGNIQNELPPELAEKVIGLSVGKTVSAGVKQTHTNRRGEPVEHTDTYTLTLKEIRATRLPELDDEFAKDLGQHDTLEEMRASIRTDLEKREEDRRRNASISSVLDAIIEKNPFDAPRALVNQARVDSMMRDSYQLSRFGLRLEDVVTDPASYIASQSGEAEKNVKSSLILKALAKSENVEVTDDDIKAEIADMADKAGRKPLAIRAELEAEKKLDALGDSIRDRKLFDFLLENNTVEMVAAPPPEADESESADAEQAKPKAKKAKPKAKTEIKDLTETKTKAKTETKAKPKTKAKAEPRPKTKTETKTKAKAKSTTSAKPKTKPSKKGRGSK